MRDTYLKRLTLGFALIMTLGVSTYVLGVPGPPSRTIPYQGRLEFGGVPYNGTVDLTFYLYETATPDLNDPTVDDVWTSTVTSVPVRDGAFAVLLGQSTPIAATVFDHQELYLRINVGGTLLAGLQRVHAAPMAIRAGRAYNFDVENDLTVNNNVVVNGDVSASSMTAATLSAPLASFDEISAETTGGVISFSDDVMFSNTVHFDREVTFDRITTDPTVPPVGAAQSGRGIDRHGWGPVFAMNCPWNQMVCGLQVRDENDQGSNDDTGINGIGIVCCTIGD